MKRANLPIEEHSIGICSIHVDKDYPDIKTYIIDCAAKYPDCFLVGQNDGEELFETLYLDKNEDTAYAEDEIGLTSIVFPNGWHVFSYDVSKYTVKVVLVKDPYS